mmetsp:Transcript_61366/g.126731  ORF Transcript_61366/g.126731 Transcript_61366/m.126731 type:complete len:214 (-) Transcript_61366:545-1186(-)
MNFSSSTTLGCIACTAAGWILADWKRAGSFTKSRSKCSPPYTWLPLTPGFSARYRLYCTNSKSYSSIVGSTLSQYSSNPSITSTRVSSLLACTALLSWKSLSNCLMLGVRGRQMSLRSSILSRSSSNLLCSTLGMLILYAFSVTSTASKSMLLSDSCFLSLAPSFACLLRSFPSSSRRFLFSSFKFFCISLVFSVLGWVMSSFTHSSHFLDHP